MARLLTISDMTGWTFVPVVPTEYINCHDCVVVPHIQGGGNCLTFTGCTGIIVLWGTLADPDGPNDPLGHCAGLIGCNGVLFVGVTFSSTKPSGDKLGIFQSHNTFVSACSFDGPNEFSKSDIAACVCVDKGSTHIELDSCQLDGPGPVGISVAWGRDIKIINNVIGSAEHPFSASGVQIGGSYATVIRRVTIAGNKFFVDKGCPRVWAEPKRVVGLMVDGVKRC